MKFIRYTLIAYSLLSATAAFAGDFGGGFAGGLTGSLVGGLVTGAANRSSSSNGEGKDPGARREINNLREDIASDLKRIAQKVDDLDNRVSALEGR